MTTAATSAAISAAIAAAIANAVKASVTLVRLVRLVRLEPAELQKILERREAPLVVAATGAACPAAGTGNLTSYLGFGFYAQSREPLHLASCAEVVATKQICMPS